MAEFLILIVSHSQYLEYLRCEHVYVHFIWNPLKEVISIIFSYF